MKEVYDFSRAERNRFYRPGTTHELPLSLEPDAHESQADPEPTTTESPDLPRQLPPPPA